jgi:hypothetical protein
MRICFCDDHVAGRDKRTQRPQPHGKAGLTQTLASSRAVKIGRLFRLTAIFRDGLMRVNDYFRRSNFSELDVRDSRMLAEAGRALYLRVPCADSMPHAIFNPMPCARRTTILMRRFAALLDRNEILLFQPRQFRCTVAGTPTTGSAMVSETVSARPAYHDELSALSKRFCANQPSPLKARLRFCQGET